VELALPQFKAEKSATFQIRSTGVVPVHQSGKAAVAVLRAW
jgi:hypothetical protein